MPVLNALRLSSSVPFGTRERIADSTASFETILVNSVTIPKATMFATNALPISFSAIFVIGTEKTLKFPFGTLGFFFTACDL